MRGLALIGLLVYTGGAFAYGMTLVYWLREVAHPTANPRRLAPGWLQEIDVVNGAMLVVSLLWFCVNAATLFLRLGPHVSVWPLGVLGVFLAFAFPPLIMHTTWAEVVQVRKVALGRVWRAMLWPVYVLAVGVPFASLTIFLRVPSTMPLYGAADNFLVLSQVTLFIIAAVYGIVLIAREPARQTRARQEQRSLVGLFGLMVVLFLVLFAGWIPGLRTTGNLAAIVFFALEIAAKSLPLAFIFVGAYFESRFDFFDLFVKRGVALVASAAVLAAGFAVALPVLGGVGRDWLQPWLYAVVLLPVVAALPWITGRIAAVLDRRWLGRRFTAVEAITRFLTGLKSATSEAQVIARAEEGLGEIFGASCRVRLDPDTAGDDAPFVVMHEAAVQSGEVSLARILMGPRASDAPYFSEDVGLLASLGDVFGSVLVNLRLQEKRKEQEQRAHELSLHASRSELKALRAQINPHFLFNALNAIAGLIHRNPRAADRTIEQLADVFRYALRGAESEWAALGDEVDFIEAYLEVERARFGDRLHVDVHVNGDARHARVPTMAVQTLVENAVKHGLSELRGQAFVRVDASRQGDTLTVSVADNGPGFSDRARNEVDAAPGARGGYGLSNVRQRLHGYFGDGAALVIERDHARGETVVSLRLPLILDAATPAAAESLTAQVPLAQESRR